MLAPSTGQENGHHFSADLHLENADDLSPREEIAHVPAELLNARGTLASHSYFQSFDMQSEGLW